MRLSAQELTGMKSKIKNIIFDWSGVIKDALENHVWVVNRMFKNLGGGEITVEEMQQKWEQPYMKFWRKYYPDMRPKQQSAEYRKAILSKDCPDPKPYPGIVKLIKKLKIEGFSMAVLSGDLPATLFSEMKKFGLENIFKETIVDVYDKSKAIEGLIKRNNFKKEETVIIGDSDHEIETGGQVGVKTIAVTWGFTSEERLKKLNPDYLVHNAKELEKILLP